MNCFPNGSILNFHISVSKKIILFSQYGPAERGESTNLHRELTLDHYCVCLIREGRDLPETNLVNLQHCHGDQLAGFGLHGSLLQEQVSH